tara:strand:- start:47 stop:1627 length:1581 start_codon:yes stop_codon:yes gene_type:complete
MAFGDITREENNFANNNTHSNTNFLWLQGLGVDDDLPVFEDPLVNPETGEPWDPEWAGWKWCCIPLKVMLPLVSPAAAGGIGPFYKGKKKVCIPCRGVDPAFSSQANCKRGCYKRERIDVGSTQGGGTSVGSDQDGGAVPGTWTPIVCVAEKYTWTGEMILNFTHALPSSQVLMEMINNAAAPHSQDYYSPLLPTSRGIEILGRYDEKVVKTPMWENLDGDLTAEQIADVQGSLGCQDTVAPARIMEVQCQPMIEDLDNTQIQQQTMFNTSIRFKFENEHCITKIRGLSIDDPRIQGPMGGPGGASNPDRCGGTDLNCRSRQSYEFEIKANPENWDVLDPGFQSDDQYQGGPNGTPIQMILKVKEMDPKGCRPCCNGNTHSEKQTVATTTGAFSVAQFLAWFLREVNGNPNPGVGGAGFEWGGERACCRTVVKRAWNVFMMPLLLGQAQHLGLPKFYQCGSAPVGQVNFPTTPQTHLMHTYGVQAIDSAGYPDPHREHQGYCMYRASVKSCVEGRLGSGPPMTDLR